jgi:hypothetical protein
VLPNISYCITHTHFSVNFAGFWDTRIMAIIALQESWLLRTGVAANRNCFTKLTVTDGCGCQSQLLHRVDCYGRLWLPIAVASQSWLLRTGVAANRDSFTKLTVRDGCGCQSQLLHKVDCYGRVWLPIAIASQSWLLRTGVAANRSCFTKFSWNFPLSYF